MIEMVILACLIEAPTKCDELRMPTGYISVGNCEREGLILVAGIMLNYPERKATNFHCAVAGSEYDT